MTESFTGWQVRNEHDQRMIDSVYVGNEYGIPADMTGKVVLDIGGNIGTFARLCAERGALVTSFEPEEGNAVRLLKHTKGLPVRVVQKAVWEHSRGVELSVDCDPSGYTVARSFGEQRVTVPSVTLEQAVSLCQEHWSSRRVHLCKIDAEGAEYPLLRHCKFEDVDELLVEFHGAYSTPDEAETLRQRLGAIGFREQKWQAVHPEFGWLRLYHGQR